MVCTLGTKDKTEVKWGKPGASVLHQPPPAGPASLGHGHFTHKVKDIVIPLGTQTPKPQGSFPRLGSSDASQAVGLFSGRFPSRRLRACGNIVDTSEV